MRPRPDALWVGLLVLVALYYLSPLLTSVHVEGFSAQIQIGAIAANAHRLGDANILYPLHAEYFYLTRVGVVLLLQALMRIVGSGDIAFRILTAASFLLFAGATLAIARRHSQASLPVLALALLLTPGLAALGFYFNDNVVSAAFGMLGIALLPRQAGQAATVFRGLLAGAALGLAIVARPDAVLLLISIAGFAWLDEARLPRLVALGALILAGVLGVFAASAWATGVTIMEAVQIGRFFDAIQGNFRQGALLGAIFVLSFGLPNLVLLPIGLWQALREQIGREGGLKRALVLVAWPLALLIYTSRSATETRQVYPLLAPFVVIHGARGLQWIGASLRGFRMRRAIAAAWVAGTALVLLAPPVLAPVSDGPRAVVGWLWSPLLWFKWQSAMAETLGIGSGLSKQAASADRTVVITTSFNPDHFLRLRLWQDGWQPIPAATAWPGCQGFEAWRRDGHELDHVRTEDPHLVAREPFPYVAAIQIDAALRCEGLMKGVPVFAFDVGPQYNFVMRYLYGAVPELATDAVSFAWPAGAAQAIQARLPGRLNILQKSTAIGQAAQLTPDQVAGLSRIVADGVARHAGLPDAPSYGTVMAEFTRGLWK